MTRPPVLSEAVYDPELYGGVTGWRVFHPPGVECGFEDGVCSCGAKEPLDDVTQSIGVPDVVGEPVRKKEGTSRETIAFLLWQVRHGILKAEDRLIGKNWFLTPVGSQHVDDEAERPHWLGLADEVIGIVESSLPTRIKGSGWFG